MSHYDTLGVEKDATAAEIKRAYRKRASKAHPDRGGKTEDMAKLNRALAVLEDPARRAEYDATGQDSGGKTLNEKAADLLKQVINSALTAPDGMFIDAAKRMLAQGVRDGEADIEKVEKRRAQLTRRRKAVKHKGKGPNLVHLLIDQQLNDLHQRRAQMDGAIDVLVAAGAMLDAYELDELVSQEAAGYGVLNSWRMHRG